MSELTTQILDAVQGDTATIQALASAVARQDGEAVRGLLGARGLHLSADEVGSLLSQAARGGDPAAFTFTFT